MRAPLLALVALALGVVATSVPSEAVQPPAVLATDFQFLPEALVVPRGTTVTWVKGLAALRAHTATADDLLFNFDSTFVALGQPFGSFTFNQASGTVITYHCIPHAPLGMVGAIVVV